MKTIYDMEGTNNKNNCMENNDIPHNELEDEEKRMGAFVRMNYYRQHASQPDLDEVWNAFQKRTMKDEELRTKRKEFSIYHLSAAAI